MVTKKTMKWTIIVLWIVCAVILAVFLSACGSSSKTYETIENNITIEEPYEVPGGTTIIVDGSDGTMITQENQTITIDCGGSCGDITIGIPVE